MWKLKKIIEIVLSNWIKSDYRTDRKANRTDRHEAVVYQMKSAELLAFLSKHEKHGVDEVEEFAEKEQPGDLQHFTDLLLTFLARIAPVAACVEESKSFDQNRLVKQKVWSFFQNLIIFQLKISIENNSTETSQNHTHIATGRYRSW